MKLDQSTALLAYSDFRIKDGEGAERKCLVVRKIHVERCGAAVNLT